MKIQIIIESLLEVDFIIFDVCYGYHYSRFQSITTILQVSPLGEILTKQMHCKMKSKTKQNKTKETSCND